MSLYGEILGERFASLPQSVQRMHQPRPRLSAAGRCSVRRGKGFLVPVIAAIMRFPEPGEDLPLHFEIEALEGAERWRRRFAGSELVSTFRAHAGRLRENMGPLCLEQNLDLRADGLHLVPCRAWFLGVPLPHFLVPRVRAVAGEEQAADGPRYVFDVAAGLPWIGEVVRYRGWLRPD